jgi:hypothetical protein
LLVWACRGLCLWEGEIVILAAAVVIPAAAVAIATAAVIIAAEAILTTATCRFLALVRS